MSDINKDNFHVDTSILDGNSKYQALLKANPNLNFDYNMPWYESLGRALGFRTTYDKIVEDKAQLSRDYESQLVSQFREEQYNSAQEQVEREREAGINPDLAGNVDAGQATEFAEPEFQPTPDNSFGNAISNLMSVLGGMMAFGKDLGQIDSLLLGNDSQRLGLSSEYMNLGSRFIMETLNEKNISRFDPVKGEFDTDVSDAVWNDEIKPALLQESRSSMADKYGLTRKQRRYLAKAQNDLMSGVKTKQDFYRLVNSFNKEKLQYGESNSLTKDMTSDQLDEVFSIVGSTVYELYKESNSLRLRKAKADSLNNIPEGQSFNEAKELEDSTLQHTENVEHNIYHYANEAANSSNESITASKNAEGVINRQLEKMMTKLEKESDKGNNFASIGLSLIASILAYSKNPVPVHFNNSDAVTTNYDYSESHPYIESTHYH